MSNSAVPIGTLISGGEMSYNTMNSSDPSPKTVLEEDQNFSGTSSISTPTTAQGGTNGVNPAGGSHGASGSNGTNGTNGSTGSKKSNGSNSPSQAHKTRVTAMDKENPSKDKLKKAGILGSSHFSGTNFSGSNFSGTSFSGSTFKLLKACNFCRKRKIKCTVLRNNSICESCKEHNRECIFDHKVINKDKDKTKVTKSTSLPKSYNVKAKISESITNNSKNLSSYTGTFLDQIDSFAMEEYNKSVNHNDEFLGWGNGHGVGHGMHGNVDIGGSGNGNGSGNGSGTGANAPQDHSTGNSVSGSGSHGSVPNIDDSLKPTATPTHIRGVDSPRFDMNSGNNTGPNHSSGSILGINGLKPYQSNSRNALKESYLTHIEPYTPFLSLDVFDEELDNFSKCCINIAAVSSLNNRLPEPAANFFLDILNESFQNHIEWNPTKLSCFFLLPQRSVVPKKVVRQSLLAFNDLYCQKMNNNESISLNLVAGALCVDAWYSLFNETRLITDPTISKKCCEIFKTMDISAFNYQFVNVNIFLYKLVWLIDEPNISSEEKRDELIRFEFNMLLFPAKLSKNLIVVKDTLLATPEAFILHILHNMLMITYYTRAVTNPEYGEMTSLTAVPGLYHFISGMAISNFRVTEQIAGRWSVVADCQIYTSKLLLQLYNVMEFDTFTFTLQFYSRRPNSNFEELEYITIDNEVQDFLNSNAIRDRDDDFDGAVVFWVFRDVRSMSLQLYINDRKRRGSEASDATT